MLFRVVTALHFLGDGKGANFNRYALYMALDIRKLNWFAPVYMELVAHTLKCIIYPSLKGARRIWA